MKIEDAAYLAGFIDGEGNISVNPEECAMKIMVGNTNEQVIRWIHSTTGYGSVYLRKKQMVHWNQLYVWQVSNAHDCKKLLDDIRPFLRVKATEADQLASMIASMQQRMDRLDERNSLILAAIDRGEMQRDIAARFGISQQLVSRLKRGHTWPSEIRRLNGRRGLKKFLRPKDQIFRIDRVTP